jgi:uncharacterized protein (TIGR02391 family)
MHSIFSIIPDPQKILELEVEEFAGIVMEYLHGLPDNERWRINRHNQVVHRTSHPEAWPLDYRNRGNEYWSRISRAFMEAWGWLEKEGFLAPDPEQDGCFFITRRGDRVKGTADLDAIRKADQLPRKILHPVIAQKAWSLFMRGEYDTAVFQAFKEVEVAVRDGAHFNQTDYGVRMIRNAFHLQNGRLTDLENPDEGERQAMSDLFAGAIGLYKNPHSHRHVGIDAEAAVEMIMLASHLLRIVDERVGTANHRDAIEGSVRSAGS